VRDPRHSAIAGGRGEIPVLVKIGEIGEDGERIGAGTVGDRVVRLRPLDDCSYRGWNGLDVLTTYHLKVATVLEDRKLGFSSALGSGVDGVVETVAEVLDGITDEERPVIGDVLSLDGQAVIDDLFRRTLLTLYSDYISLSVLEGPGFRANRVHVFYAPAELLLR
jgi:hypothetical protein